MTYYRPEPARSILRILLGCLLAIIALNAFGGGTYGLTGAKDVPLEWLEGTPFRDYFLPSLILLVVIGGSSLFAAIVVFRNSLNSRKVASLSGWITLIWIAVETVMIGYVSWMQPVTAIAGLLVLILASLLPYRTRAR